MGKLQVCIVLLEQYHPKESSLLVKDVELAARMQQQAALSSFAPAQVHFLGTACYQVPGALLLQLSLLPMLCKVTPDPLIRQWPFPLTRRNNALAAASVGWLGFFQNKKNKMSNRITELRSSIRCAFAPSSP